MSTQQARNRVITGMALGAITLNFWRLNYILPAIGMVLSLLGFRTLRHGNQWFRHCFRITVLRAAILFSTLVLHTTIAPETIVTASVSSALTAANLLLSLAGFYCFWRGLKAAQETAGLPPHAGAAAAMIVWYALVYGLSILRYQGWLLAIAMVIGYFVILYKLCQLSNELEEAGYAIQAEPAKVSDGQLVCGLFSAFLVCCAIGYLFGGSYPMDWKPVESSEDAETARIRDRLAALGFPEYVLDDLAPEDLAACEGVLQVVTDVTDEPISGETGASEYALRMTGIGVQISDSPDRWMIFHHFLWTASPSFYGTESIRLLPAYQSRATGCAQDGPASGRVLCDKGGETFAAPYYFIGERTFTSSNMFWGEQTSTDTFAAFSLPRQSEHPRGYITYPIVPAQKGYLIDSWIYYTHQQSWFQYPVMTAMEHQMKDSLNPSGAFLTIQDALDFFPEEVD